jgi:hypothetical protein
VRCGWGWSGGLTFYQQLGDASSSSEHLTGDGSIRAQTDSNKSNKRQGGEPKRAEARRGVEKREQRQEGESKRAEARRGVQESRSNEGKRTT